MAMNDFDRNTRTLIVCFVVAVFALIPLRFIEVGEQYDLVSSALVLGESISVPVEPVLEAPYNTLEKCINTGEVVSLLQKNGLNETQIGIILEGLKKAEAIFCK